MSSLNCVTPGPWPVLLRGLYCSSPFIRALQTSPQETAGVQESVVQVLARCREVVGGALMPHFCFSNSPRVNSSSYDVDRVAS